MSFQNYQSSRTLSRIIGSGCLTTEDARIEDAKIEDAKIEDAKISGDVTTDPESAECSKTQRQWGVVSRRAATAGVSEEYATAGCPSAVGLGGGERATWAGVRGTTGS